MIWPEQETVIVTTAYTLDMQAMLDAMWTHLRPASARCHPASGPHQVGLRKASSVPG